MKIQEVYEVIFSAVMLSKGLQWWELFDGPDFEIVESLCRDLDGFDEQAFNEWTHEMAEDL
jgi:hypothetical protein